MGGVAKVTARRTGFRRVQSSRGKRVVKNSFLVTTSERGRSMSTVLEKSGNKVEVVAPAPLALYDTTAFERRSDTFHTDLIELKKRNAKLKAQIAALNREEATRDFAAASASMTPQTRSMSPSKRESKLDFKK